MSNHTQTLKSLIAAWREQNVDGVLDCLHDDVTWNNSGGFRAPIVGKAAMGKTLRAMAEGISENRWRLFDVTEVGDMVWMEGVDEFTQTDGVRVAIPYAGVLEFRDGVIIKWREYFDGRLIEQMRAGEGVSEYVEAMLDRPEV